MNKILVTGSEGMLGRALIRSLNGHNSVQAIGTDLLSKEHKLDIVDANQVSGFIKGIMPDIIIHAAAYTDVDGCEKHHERAYAVNAEGTKNIAQSARDTNAFLIHISTDYVFDGEKNTPYIESDTTNPIGVYGKSKLAGEEAIRDMLDNYLIIRTSWLFGRDGKNFVDSILKKAEAGECLKVVDDQHGCPTYTEDLSFAITNLLFKSCNLQPATCHLQPAVLHITNSGTTTWYEFAKEILQQKGISNVEISPASSDEIARPAKRPKLSVLDNKEYIKITGQALPSWQDALSRYLQASGGVSSPTD